MILELAMMAVGAAYHYRLSSTYPSPFTLLIPILP
jgi:hypothetical protein